jgi:hypothetical protein
MAKKAIEKRKTFRLLLFSQYVCQLVFIYLTIIANRVKITEEGIEIK